MKVLAVLTALVMVVSCTAVLYNSQDVEKGMGEGGGKGVISLVAPPFIGVAGAAEGGGSVAPRAGTTFLEEEAGISAYTDVEETIDLEKAKTVFRTIEYETDEYIIGSVALPDYPETEDVHAYVHKDGWIVTYYLNEEPAAKILDWADYGTDEKITGTKLEDGMSVVCNAAGVPMRNIKYYDFKYANADKLMVVADALWSPGTDTFKLKLPSDFVFYERSFSHYCRESEGNWIESDMYIDEKKISCIYQHPFIGEETNYGLLSPTQLSLAVFHTIKITGRNTRGTFDAIVLIYQEA
ncbi:MAG: hypothetical protein H8D26_02950 [Methanomicrobia archaeon]|nr:hypothetical protein [Methanomicrobia archaeon]